VTVVVSFFRNGDPVLVGDLLLSGNEPTRPGWLPSVGSVANVFPVGSGYVPIGLVQKIAVLNDNLVVGWSGSMIHARAVIRAISNECASWSWHPNHVDVSIKSIIEQYEAANDISLIWNIYDGNNNRVFQNGYNAAQYSRTTRFGRILAIGTPDAIGDIGRRLESISHDPAVGEHGALGHAIATTAMLSLVELLDPNALASYVGGGYEVVLLAERRFQKLDDFVFVVWNAEEESTGGYRVGAPYYFERHLYHDGVLAIRAAKLEGMSSNSATYTPTTFLAGRADRPLTLDEVQALPHVNLNGSLIINIVSLAKPNVVPEVIIRASRWVTQERLMRISESDNGQISVDFRLDYFRSLIMGS
jgi:hypothetical protein